MCLAVALQPVCCLYVDNAQSTAHKWEKVLPGVVVKQDPWHLQQRIMRAVGDPNHPAYDSFRGDISKAIMRVDPAEAGSLQAKLDNPSVSAQEKMRAWRQCRKVIDDGVQVWQRLTAVVEEYEELTKEPVDPMNLKGPWSSPFITKETKTALHNQEELITSGYLTDPFPVDMMYYTDSKGVLRSHRSESQAENIIRGWVQG
jgi:hypothetical protein